MPLSAGDKLGAYEIVAAIGKGGMGEVWRARDPQLGRDVAIKVSAQQFTDRFEREARAIAALNQANVCTLYHIGPNYLVMEYIEGQTLGERIKEGPIPLEEALTIARQIADALEAAHEKGIVHRDLKPANVKIRPDGSVKVLDFGLAKSTGAQEVTPDSPTMMPGTQMGMILGTAGYMSPEQARGQEVDKRADIWAFGVVLYEMLTGKRLFEGATVSDSLAAILRAQPDLTLVPEKTRRLLGACLEKDPRKRLRDIGDVWRLLEDPPAAGGKRRRAAWLPWIAAAVLAGLAVFGWTRSLQPAATVPNDVALSIVPPAGKELRRVGQLHIDRISRDGSAVLFSTDDGRLYVRKLNSLEAEPLPEFRAAGDAFWAPDSQSVAFPTANGLMKMRLPKGIPEAVTTQKGVGARGGSWGDQGGILLSTIDSLPGKAGLYSVSAAGGAASFVQVPGLTAGRVYNPEFLPGGQDFLFAFAPRQSQETQIYLATLRDGRIVNPKLLFNNDTSAAYTPAGGGRILFVRNDNLYSWKLDRKAGKLMGEPELVQEHVASAAGPRTPQFSVSDTGTIAWRSGTAVVSQLTVFDRQGNRIGVAGVPAPVNTIDLAPDEQHLFTAGEAGSWIVEAMGPGRSVFSGGLVTKGLWSADGSRVIHADGTKILEGNLSGATLRQLAEIPVGESLLLLNDISPDGMRLLYGDQSRLYIYSLMEKRSTEIVGQHVDNAVMSPDGAWIAYRPFTEPGIYVQPLSGKGLRRQIAAGGNLPVWRKDGKEILCINQGKIWSVRVEGSGEQLRFSMPEPLFSAQPPSGTNSGSRPLAVNRDGTRIYYLQSVDEPEAGVIDVRTGAIR